jgi:2-polyprenyl-6-methoxyphenol hydroxylase-like FAD-dependent oxidoreductase
MSRVLIVGAGPVGMTAAIELARYGIPVRVVDKAAQRTDQSKALVLWSRTLELLDRSGGAAPFVEAGFKVNAVNILNDHGGPMGHLSMQSIHTPYPYALMLPQSETERLLEERLQSFGVTIERNVEMVSLTNKANAVDVVLRDPAGTEEAVSADWLLGCDGAHSAVRHAIGSAFSGETMLADFMLADIHMSGYPFPDNEMAVYWHHDGVVVIFPISPGRYRLIADLPMTPGDRPPTPTQASVQAIIDTRGPGGISVSDPIWLAGFRINGRKVADYRDGRVFLLGDAAHIHSPAGGQGMNTGMQDAFNLAWKLALVVKGVGGDKLLESYSPERSAVGDQVLKAAGRLTTIGTLKNPIARGVRDVVSHFMLGLNAVKEKVADDMSEVSIGYPESPLNGPSDRGPKGANPGERVPPVSGQAAFGAGDTPRFALCADAVDVDNEALDDFRDVLDTERRPALSAGVMTLVRPDGYIACSARSARDIARYLAALRPS